ncbi:MAG TPA: glutamine synthetase family protein [Polyangiaceae bacterium]|nr:glutamine synthetase family protein [Polyangiaceae bacterium]
MANRPKQKPQQPAQPKAPKPTPSSASASDFAADEWIRALQAEGVQRVKVGGFDLDGVLRGKYISLDKLRSALNSGFGFCDVIFGWDVADALYDNATVTGWNTGYPDILAILDPKSRRRIPWEPGVAAMLCDFHLASGAPHPACPRSLLKRVVAKANAMDFEPKVGVEFEFFFFKETRDTLQAKGFRNLQPLDPGMFGYSWVRTGQDAELMRQIWDGCKSFGIELEGLHTETGPGVYEAAIHYDAAVDVADQAALFKTTLRQIAHQNGLAVTFMAKCNANLPGSSGHLHQSLWSRGKNAFYDARKKHGMSESMQHYIAGQLQLMRELTALYSPTINSYKRTVPGLWAPLVACWGVENRTCSVRVVAPNDPKAVRVEYRQTAADINPYVAIASSLAAGLYGIEKRLALGPEVVGDAGESGPNALPRSLKEATALLAQSKVAGQIVGAEFVDHYVRTRDWEVRQFERAVTDWELQRYFETV